MKLIKAVDVSSHNKPSITTLSRWISDGCQLLMIHSYHREEQAELKDSTIAWIDLARTGKCWALPYSWLFRSGNPKNEVTDSINLFRSQGEDPKLIGLDCEVYPKPFSDPGPTAEQILIAAETARSMGVEPILYSNTPWLEAIAGDFNILRGVPGWIANWNGKQDLNIPVPDWVRIIAHQYTDTPEDWSVFDYDAMIALIQTPNPCAELQEAVKKSLTYKGLPKAVRNLLTKALGV